MKFVSHRHAFCAGLTLVEVLVTVTITGVLAGIAIPVYTNLTDRSKEVVAGDHVEALNKAVTKFSQNCWKLTTAPNATATTDEFLVLRTLQYKFPATDLKLGSPFFDQRYNPAASSSTDALRIRWNGSSFELLKPGTSGTGLLYTDGSDYTNAYTFPDGYKPAGAN